MKNRDDKQKDLEALRKDIERAKNLFVTGFEKLKVSQDFELRKAVRGAGGHYRVIKNNIAAKASEGRFSTPSPARTRFSVVLERALSPNTARQPSQNADDIGAKFAEPSSFSVEMRTTGVPGMLTPATW